MCCGDDPNEYVKSGYGYTKCCSSSSDMINGNGLCCTDSIGPSVSAGSAGSISNDQATINFDPATDDCSGVQYSAYRITLYDNKYDCGDTEYELDSIGWTSSRSVTFSSLSPNSKYYWKVEARDNLGKIGESDCEWFTTTGCTTSDPCCDSSGNYIPSGNDGDCAACQTCSGSSGSCVDYADHAFDTTSPNYCNGAGDVCYSGECVKRCDSMTSGAECNGVGATTSWCQSSNYYTHERYFKPGDGNRYCELRFGSGQNTCWCECPTGYVEAFGKCVQKCGSGTGEVCAGYKSSSCSGTDVQGFELKDEKNDYCNYITMGNVEECWCEPNCCATDQQCCSVSSDCCEYDGTVEGAYCFGGGCRKDSTSNCLEDGYSEIWKCNPNYSTCVNPQKTKACCIPTGSKAGLSGGIEDDIEIIP